mgnify:CR=1 FL=1
MNTIIKQQVSEDYNIKLVEVVPGDAYCAANGEYSYINASYCAGDEIWLGIYDDEELKEISFWHELGHCVGIYPNEYWKLQKWVIEKIAWTEGLKIAKQHGLKFSIKALRWAVQQFQSYMGWEMREVMGYFEPHDEYIKQYYANENKE